MLNLRLPLTSLAARRNGGALRIPGVRRGRGFTLVELMIGLVIMAVLLMMGVPAFSIFIQNSKLRSSAETFHAGIQTARAEAVKRNSLVEFILTDDPGDPSSTQTAVASTTGSNWLIRVQDPTTLLYSFVEGRNATQGAGTTATSVVVTGTVSTVTFNGFGGTRLGAAATFAFTNPSGGACAAASGPMRCLSIVVSVGGQARMCDPAISATGDTRKC